MGRILTSLAMMVALSAGVVLTVPSVSAQPVVSFPNTYGATYPSGGYPPQGSEVLPPSSTMPPGLGAPTFDPYAAGGNAASVPPSLNAAPAPYGTPYPPGVGGAPGTFAPYPGATGNVLSSSPTMAPYAQPYGTYPPGAAPGTYPPGAAPGTFPPSPPSLFPNGTDMVPWGMPATRFLTPRVRYTWVDGGEAPDDLGINDFDFSVVAAFPNFLFSTQPLYVAPSFSLHLWSGPEPPVGDLPPNAFSAYLDFGWSSDPAKPFGADVGFRPGIFTDFNTFTTYSWRFMGQGMFWVQTTPTTTVRGGVIYIDRNDLKLLPAFGLLWTPNTQTRFDIFFPRPKLAQHLTTTGSTDLWWYVGGEYGGGAWTVKRESPAGPDFSDRMDINDIRVMLGLEWGQSAHLQQGRRTGFVEVGWVTAREIVYVVNPETHDLRDSFMVRAGWNY
ncbi:MAG: hypothetical protein ACYC4U_07360 [Pirellulaceae bacterium]